MPCLKRKMGFTKTDVGPSPVKRIEEDRRDVFVARMPHERTRESSVVYQ